MRFFFNPLSGQVNAGPPREIVYADTAPQYPLEGSRWFDTINLREYVYTGTEWVESGVGPAGVKGDTGEQGPVGPIGPIGATGPQGPAATIAVGAVTTGDPGTSVSVANSGTTSAAKFDFTIPRGAVGATGAVGPQGPQGIQGEKGDVGNTGPQGIQGLKGDKGDTGAIGPVGPVGPQGIQGLKGDKGDTGAVGATGAVGPAGTAASVSVGTTTTGNAGTNAAVTNSGTASAAVFNFTVPRGATGATGAVGPQGPAGTSVVLKGSVAQVANLPTTGNTAGDLWVVTATGDGHVWSSTTNSWSNVGPIRGPAGATGATGAVGPAGTAASVSVGTTTTGAAGTNAAVTNSGTASAAVFNFTVPRGATGATGATGAVGAVGPAGTAASVSVGTTTTGAAGTNAAVTNSGTTSAAVFNFTVPRGATGATGATGAVGPQGPQGIKGDTGNTGAQGPAGPAPAGTGAVVVSNGALGTPVGYGTANTINTLVQRDASGNFSAGTVTANVTGNVSGSSGSCTGNAATATKLATPRAINVSGDVTGTAQNFDGSVAITIPTAIAAGVIVNADINAAAAISDTKLATISTANKVSNSATTATSANTASAIVARDANGNFTAGTVTAALSGNATSASSAAKLTTARTINGTSFDGSADITITAAPTAHNHDASNITAGTLANDRLPARLKAAAYTITDWNNALENGWYQGNQAANAPEGVLDWWLGYVEAHYDRWVTQTVHRFTQDAPTNTQIWRRSSSDSAGARVWGAWYKLQLSQGEQDARYAALVHPHAVATTTTDGFLSAADKTKLNEVTYYKSPVSKASTANVAGTYNNGVNGVGATITGTATNFVMDGNAFGGTTGRRFLLKDQTVPAQNGVYVLSNVGYETGTPWVLTRATDADSSLKLNQAIFPVSTGTANGGELFTFSVGSGTFGTTALITATAGSVYVHPTTDGNLHVPATGTANNGKVLKAGSTAGSFSWGTLTAADVGAATTAHTHGNITNAGAIGVAASLPIITGTSGVLQAGSFGTTAGTFCQGNDARLSDSRTPTAHTHDDRYYTETEVNTLLGAKQNSLGFTPVQQGGGTGQGTNKIYIGWSGSELQLQVDSTNFGANWPINVAGAGVPPGAIMAFAMNSVPTGWLAANGAVLLSTTYPALYNAIGTTYGSSTISILVNGVYVPTPGFYLPDLRGIFVRGSGSISLNPTRKVTITQANPAVVNWEAHGLVANTKVQFTTTGQLPTGLTPITVYYVLSAGLTADTFRVSATQGGAAIATTSAGSGVHTATCPSPFKYSADFSAKQQATFQGHYHSTRAELRSFVGPGVGWDNWLRAPGIGSAGSDVAGPVSDGVNGTPSTSSETRPANIALLYCIKF